MSALPLTSLAPSTQAHYQVRYDVGVDAVARIGVTADVVVWVDALPQPVPAANPMLDAPPIPFILADLRNRTAVAELVLRRQVERGDRVAIAVIAAGPGVEDALAAGAVIDALQILGIDFASPEAAVVCAGFVGLRRAVGHLVSASIAGQEFAATGRAAELATYGRLDSVPTAEFHSGQTAG